MQAEADRLFDDLRRLGTLRQFRRGESLVRASAEGGPIIAVQHGVCKVNDVDAEGREVVVAIRGPGEVFGEISALTGSGATASVVAMTQVRAAMVTRQMFQDFLADADNARRVAILLAHRLTEATAPARTAHLKVDGRLADRLLDMATRFGTDSPDGRIVRLPLTHDELAGWIGATRAVTTRTLGALREAGHIDFGRGWWSILDPDGLRGVTLDQHD